MKFFSNGRLCHSQENKQSVQPLRLLKHQSNQAANVLVVDNDLDNLYLWETLFEAYGAKVTACRSVKSALASLDDCVPDIVVCEVRFLDEDVTPLVDRVKNIAARNDKEIPIMIASTYAFSDFVNCFHHLIAKISAYLRKPIDIDEFIDTASDLLNTKRRL